jgi:hypothetical protein
MAWFLVDAQNIIDNIIEYDGVSLYTPPNGLKLVNYTGSEPASPGYSWDGTNPVAPAISSLGEPTTTTPSSNQGS